MKNEEWRGQARGGGRSGSGENESGPAERVTESGCQARIGTTIAVLARIARGTCGTKPLSLSGAQRRRSHPPSGALALGQHDMSPPIGQQLPGSGAASATRDGATRANRRMSAIRRIGAEYTRVPGAVFGSLWQS